MRKLALLVVFGLCGTAQAHSVLGHIRSLHLPSSTCPAGVPTQPFTVYNQAGISTLNLARVERAVTHQSLQLRAAWGTPCVTFGPGGWKLWLKGSGDTQSGEHRWGKQWTKDGGPVAFVQTGGIKYLWAWSLVFSHEIVETLVNPTTARDAWHANVEGFVEIADPVQGLAYRLNGVDVSDFVTPAWYAGATFGGAFACSQATGCAYVGGTLIAPTEAPGPYDQMGRLAGPWQTATY